MSVSSGDLQVLQGHLKAVFPEYFADGGIITKVVKKTGAKDPFVAYVQTTSHVCLEKGTHASNHAFFKITMQHFIGRCHDSDCKQSAIRDAPVDESWKGKFIKAHSTFSQRGVYCFIATCTSGLRQNHGLTCAVRIADIVFPGYDTIRWRRWGCSRATELLGRGGSLEP
jgi:hypothetical protein